MPILPPRLQVGDIIGAISPSGPVRDLNLYRRGVEQIEFDGFRVAQGDHALNRLYHMSATGSEKAADIHHFFMDPRVKAIFPTLGGHTANQVIPHIRWSVIMDNPKIICGFSDSTVLLNAIFAKTGLICYHTLCDIVFGYGIFGTGKLQTDGNYTREHIKTVLMTPTPTGPISKLNTWEGMRTGRATGTLLGGNLSSLRSLVGTEYEPNWDGAILFLEDSAEPHRWDQQLGHLELAGIFKRIAGLVIGNCERKDTFYSDGYQGLRDIIARYCEGYEFPVVYGADFGHNVENCTLPVGLTVSLDGSNAHISLINPAVS